jgi:hypothetical protein
MRFKSVVEKICTSLQKTYLAMYIFLCRVYFLGYTAKFLFAGSQKARRGKEIFAECQHPAKKYDMAQ